MSLLTTLTTLTLFIELPENLLYHDICFKILDDLYQDRRLWPNRPVLHERVSGLSEVLNPVESTVVPPSVAGDQEEEGHQGRGAADH